VIARTWFLLVAAFLAVVLPSAEAWAQASITVDKVNVVRRDDREEGLSKTGFNYDDCKADETIEVAYKIAGSPPILEVWIGSGSVDCSNVTTRQQAGNIPGNCWRVGAVNAPTNGSIDLRVQDILPHEMSEPNTGTEAVCDNTSNGALTAYFVLMDGNVSAGTGDNLPLTFDLKGPPPPTDLGVLLGDTRLFPNWSLSSSASTDVQGYYIYCEEAAGGSGCAGTTLVAGMRPPADANERGQTGISATSGEASGLTNGVTYACGVAGFDKLFNVGNLSELVCATPEPVNGYFKQYRAAGGKGGGGYCTFARNAATPAAVLTPLAALALLVLRRRKRQNASA
jgi:hypothetical protein